MGEPRTEALTAASVTFLLLFAFFVVTILVVFIAAWTPGA